MALKFACRAVTIRFLTGLCALKRLSFLHLGPVYSVKALLNSQSPLILWSIQNRFLYFCQPCNPCLI